MSLIELKDVSYKYPNGFTAVDKVSFSIDKGCKVAIIGQNGAGKTTTVKMINGLLKPTSGTILFEGEDTIKYTTAQMSRKVGYVFQNPDDQIFNSTVYKEMEYGLKKYGLSQSEIDKRIEYAADLAGIKDYLQDNPYDLPFSLRKFVTIASVIATDCDVLIFDEPTAGQDLKGLKILSKIIYKLTSKGKSIITITHDMDFVADNFDSIIVMANKHVIDSGKAEEVFSKSEVMKEAKLKAPTMINIIDKLQINDRFLDVDSLINAINKNRNLNINR